MKFDEMFKVLPKEKENLKCEYKRCLATVLKKTLWKRDPNTFSFAYSKIFRDCFFYRTTSVAVFEVSFSIRKENKK